jgi:hypothetical protein
VNSSTLQLSLTPPIYRFDKSAQATTSLTPGAWAALPNLALLSIKHHQESGVNFWHWVVFERVDGQPFVFDSASYLPSNVRHDFEAMQPKWFIEVINA